MSNGKVVRKNIDNFSASELASLRVGYAKMQAIGDDRGYNVLAGYHGIPGFYCHRDSTLFFPWHRAYLYYFEQYLQDQISNQAVPWWDWTSNTSHTVGVPTAFNEQKTPEGDKNPLFSSHIQASSPRTGSIDRDTLRFPGSPSELPSSSEIADILQESDFLRFSNRLDFGPHGAVHLWFNSGNANNTVSAIPGDMSLLTFAAYDPIFFSHHCMIDRIWYLWQLQNGIDNIPKDLLQRVLPPFNLTVAEVLDISKLGYEYAIDQVSVIPGS